MLVRLPASSPDRAGPVASAGRAGVGAPGRSAPGAAGRAVAGISPTRRRSFLSPDRYPRRREGVERRGSSPSRRAARPCSRAARVRNGPGQATYAPATIDGEDRVAPEARLMSLQPPQQLGSCAEAACGPRRDGPQFRPEPRFPVFHVARGFAMVFR